MRKIDLTYPLDQASIERLGRLVGSDKNLLSRLDLLGHLGTHLDLMDQSYDLAKTESPGVFFNLTSIRGREITSADLDLGRASPGSFVIIHTGVLAENGYGEASYLKNPVQLSWELIDALLAKGIAFLGVDLAGIRLPAEHPQADQRAARQGTFVVENLFALGELATALTSNPVFQVQTYPLRLSGATGLPCRVVAELA